MAQLEWRGSDVSFLVTADGLRARTFQTGQFFSKHVKTGILTPAAAALYPRSGESFYRHYYRIKLFFTPNNLTTRGFYQPGYGLADANVTYAPDHGSWDVSSWLKSIGNTHYYRNVIAVGTTGIAQPGDPRTFDGTFNVRF